MKGKHAKILRAIFTHPVPGNIQWSDIEALLIAIGAIRSERAGSRIAFLWNRQVQVFHRPHPRPDTDKGAVISVRKWLEANGVTP